MLPSIDSNLVTLLSQRRLPAILLFVLSLIYSTASYSEVVYVLPNTVAADIGSGIKTLAADAAGRCLVVANPIPPGPTPGEPVVTLRSNFTSSDSFVRRVLNVSASAEFGFGGWGGSAEASFASDSSNNSFNLYYFIDVNVDLNQQLLPEYKLIQTYANISSGVQFYERCGDRAIVGVQRGGRFTVLIRFSTQSFSDRQVLQAALSGYSIGTASFEGSLSERVQKTGLKVQYSTFFFRDGVPKNEQLPNPMDLVEVERYALQFPTKVGVGSLRRYVTVDFSATQNLHPDIRPLVTSQQQYILEQLADQRSRYAKSIADIAYIRVNRAVFEEFDANELEQSRRVVALKLDEVYLVASKCSTQPSTCLSSNIPSEVEVVLPRELSQSSRFYRYTNGVILDLVTRLEWNPVTTTHFDNLVGLGSTEAEQHCWSQVGAWRLPTMREMEGLITNAPIDAIPDPTDMNRLVSAYLPDLFAKEIQRRYRQYSLKTASGTCTFQSGDDGDKDHFNRPTRLALNFCSKTRTTVPYIRHPDRGDRMPFMCVRRTVSAD